MLITFIFFVISAAASAETQCEQHLWADSVMPPRTKPFTSLEKSQARELAERIQKNIREAAHLVKQDRWDKAFDILDEPSVFYGSGIDLTPVKDRHVFEYTPSSHADLQKALVLEFGKHPTIVPMVSAFQQKIFTWMVMPVEDNPPFYVWKILWTDRMLELTEELGHAAQLFSEHGGGRWNLSKYYSVPAHQKELYDSLYARPGEDHRSSFIEADIYAFMLETFGAEFVPKSYMGTFADVRQFADRDFRKP